VDRFAYIEGDGELGEEIMSRTIRAMLADPLMFLANVGMASIGPALLEPPYGIYRLMSSSPRTIAISADFTNACLALTLGYWIYRSKPMESSKWVWAAGLCWFASRMIALCAGNGGRILELSAPTSGWDIESAITWSTYTLPCLRTVFYSAGARLRSAREQARTCGQIGHRRREGN
jgi:hypothetical protein